MNKQALAFLTMFSLVLMLSVYYVTLPDDSAKTVMKDETGKTVEKDNTKTTAKTDTSKTKKEAANTSDATAATKLQDSIDQKKEVEINKNSDIVADSKSKDEAKQQALTGIDTLKAQKTMQKSVVDALRKEGYETAVEINDTTCIVNVFDSKDEKEAAKKIMIATNGITNQKYLIEVTFK